MIISRRPWSYRVFPRRAWTRGRRRISRCQSRGWGVPPEGSSSRYVFRASAHTSLRCSCRCLKRAARIRASDHPPGGPDAGVSGRHFSVLGGSGRPRGCQRDGDRGIRADDRTDGSEEINEGRLQEDVGAAEEGPLIDAVTFLVMALSREPWISTLPVHLFNIYAVDIRSLVDQVLFKAL